MMRRRSRSACESGETGSGSPLSAVMITAETVIFPKPRMRIMRSVSDLSLSTSLPFLQQQRQCLFASRAGETCINRIVCCSNRVCVNDEELGIIVRTATTHGPKHRATPKRRYKCGGVKDMDTPAHIQFSSSGANERADRSWSSVRRGTNRLSPRVSALDNLLRVLRRSSFFLLVVLSTSGYSVYGQSSRPASALTPTTAPTGTRNGNDTSTFEPTLVTNTNATNATEAPDASPPTASPVVAETVPPSVRPTNIASEKPSQSQTPTLSPGPTTSQLPTSIPTLSPAPTLVPSDIPSFFPTSKIESFDKGFYRQGFVMPNASEPFFNDTEADTLAAIFESYTVDFAPEPNKIGMISTECSIDDQSVSSDDLNQTINTVDYTCQYTSKAANVTGFAAKFLTYVDASLGKLTFDMQKSGLEVESSLPAESRQILSPAPSGSMQPSKSPTLFPTVSPGPSFAPSRAPTDTPTKMILPTTPPNFLRPSSIPTLAPSKSSDKLSVGAIAAIVILTGLAFLAGLFLYYRSWRKKREENIRPYHESSTTAAATHSATASRSRRSALRVSRPSPAHRTNNTNNNTTTTTGGLVSPDNAPEDDETGRNVIISQTDSLLSNKSLLSAGESGLGEDSGDELDGTKNLQDEFDQYKDQNLEQLRADVEGNLSGFEGIMSAAVTNALMGDEETNVETQELLWGCNPNADGTEIEASALFEVSDWLKRNESAGGERKRAFMQEILNKMVTSVRYGVIVAEDASRTIHESAAILGLQLAEELPMTTVIISGMRKTTRAEDMIKALHEFGDIDVAAVASGKRGFGIIRFRRRKSVDRALQRYKSGEIVILDVSIQMKVLMPSGAVESR